VQASKSVYLRMSARRKAELKLLFAPQRCCLFCQRPKSLAKVNDHSSRIYHCAIHVECDYAHVFDYLAALTVGDLFLCTKTYVSWLRR